MPRRALAVFALCVVIGGAVAAPGQGADPELRAVFDRLDPAVPGVTVTVRNAPPAPPLVTVRNESGTQLEISGIDFEPFVRIGPDGVSANRRSRTFYLTQDPTGSQSIPDDARAGAVPVWAKVSATPEWGWYEPRARWTAPVPSSVRTGRRDVSLGPWNVRARHGTTTVVIEGHVVWHPIRGSMRARLVDTAPLFEGVRVNVLQGTIPALVVTNSSQRRIEITSRDGVPFARVGPGGVDVNLSSATARDNPRFGQGGAGWKHVQDGPVLSWLERRAAPPSDEPPPSRIALRTTLVRWTLPGTIGADPFSIRGVTEWVPLGGAAAPPSSSGGDALRWLVVAAVLTALAVASLLVARRRRRGSSGGGSSGGAPDGG